MTRFLFVGFFTIIHLALTILVLVSQVVDGAELAYREAHPQPLTPIGALTIALLAPVLSLLHIFGVTEIDLLNEAALGLGLLVNSVVSGVFVLSLGKLLYALVRRIKR